MVKHKCQALQVQVLRCCPPKHALQAIQKAKNRSHDASNWCNMEPSASR
jgi:hypothetical protein